MSDDERQRIDEYLAGDRFAVVGASRDRSKYGNKVLRAYLQNDRVVHPVNPNADKIEGQACYSDLATLVATVGPVHGISIITPPRITERVLDDAIDVGIGHVWMQPGAESEAAIEKATAAGINLLAGGPCVLVVLGYSESA